jgi:hypothetical protein
MGVTMKRLKILVAISIGLFLSYAQATVTISGVQDVTLTVGGTSTMTATITNDDNDPITRACLKSSDSGNHYTMSLPEQFSTPLMPGASRDLTITLIGVAVTAAKPGNQLNILNVDTRKANATFSVRVENPPTNPKRARIFTLWRMSNTAFVLYPFEQVTATSNATGAFSTTINTQDLRDETYTNPETPEAGVKSDIKLYNYDGTQYALLASTNHGGSDYGLLQRCRVVGEVANNDVRCDTSSPLTTILDGARELRSFNSVSVVGKTAYVYSSTDLSLSQAYYQFDLTKTEEFCTLVNNSAINLSHIIKSIAGDPFDNTRILIMTEHQDTGTAMLQSCSTTEANSCEAITTEGTGTPIEYAQAMAVKSSPAGQRRMFIADSSGGDDIVQCDFNGERALTNCSRFSVIRRTDPGIGVDRRVYDMAYDATSNRLYVTFHNPGSPLGAGGGLAYYELNENGAIIRDSEKYIVGSADSNTRQFSAMGFSLIP